MGSAFPPLFSSPLRSFVSSQLRHRSAFSVAQLEKGGCQAINGPGKGGGEW